MSVPRSLPAVPACLLAAIAVALSACASPVQAGDQNRAGEAVVLHNCDREVVVEQPPKRAVSLNQGTTELLLALGLQDRMVGTATWTEPVRADLAEANDAVPRLSDDTPSFESVLDTQPDFVIGLYQAIFTDERVASRERFAEFGIPTWLSPTSCLPEGTVLDKPVTLDDIYGEITDIARIFGVTERGEKLVAELQGRVERARGRVADLDLPEGFSVMYWFGQTESPYVAGATGAPGIMSRVLDVRNAYDDVDSLWPQVGWEDILHRDPSLLVLADLTRKGPGQSLESKVEFLTTDPAVAQLSAVPAKHWMPLRGTELNITISTIDGIEKLADNLVELYGDR